MPSRNIDLNRLTAAMQRARLALRYPREQRREAVRQTVGSHWSEEGTRQPVPVNLLGVYLSVVSRSLIAKAPRVMLSTFDRAQKPVVKAMQTWANEEIELMHLKETLERCVLDALYSIGICKVALASPADAALTGWQQGAGTPFAQRVDLDDFVFDIHARSFEEVGFIGHRFRAPLEVIRDGKHYSKERLSLSPSDDPYFNLEGDERIGVLGRTYLSGNSEEFEEFVDLWEVYLPRYKLVLTLADDHLSGASGGGAEGGRPIRPLRAQRWLGRETGPYHLLGMGIVPGNAMFKAPIQDLIDLHLLANNIWRKLQRQAERQKEVGFVQGAASEDGKRVIETNDGEFAKVDNPALINVVEMGGPGQKNFALFTAVKDLFSYVGGNLELLGGRGPQSKTATQDTLLNQNAAGGVADMADRTVGFTSEVLKSLCWYWWHDPQKVMRMTHSLPGLPDLTADIHVYPGMHQDPTQLRRTGRFVDLRIKVDPYSMQHSTPQSRMAALNQVVQTIVMPMMQLLQAQGIAFDINAYLQKIAEFMDMPDLADIITIQEPPATDAPTGGDKGPGMPAATQRTYTRENVSAPTTQGADHNLIAQAMGSSNGGDNRNGKVMAGLQ